MVIVFYNPVIRYCATFNVTDLNKKMLLPVIWFENLGPAAPGAAEVRFHAAPLTDQYEGWKKEGKGQQREEYRVCKGE